MSLTLRQLEVFLATAEDCNFRRAAERLGVSQPSVSGRIRALENYLGYELFDRSSGGSTRLTAQGRAFMARARHLVSGASQLSTRRSPASARSPLRLKAVIGPILLKHRVMPELPDFCYENPDIAADFQAMDATADGSELIRSGRADIFLYTGDPPEAPEIDAEVLARTGCSIFGAPELLARIGATAVAMAEAPFILPPEHYPSASWIRARLAGVGISPGNIVVRPQFPDVIVQMMLEGRGLGVFFDEFLRDGRLQKTGPALAPASRVMLIGPRARQSAAAPVLDFLRRVAAVPCNSTCQ